VLSCAGRAVLVELCFGRVKSWEKELMLHRHASAMHTTLDTNVLDSFLGSISVTFEDLTWCSTYYRLQTVAIALKMLRSRSMA
jgi:hypothetical protein